MPYRTTPFVNDEYYHIYNRGVALQPTYLTKSEYERFLLCLSYYRFSNLSCKLSRLLQISKELREQMLLKLEKENDQLVQIISFALMPNHFHLLLRQSKDGGISKFIRQITDSYTKYFNTKNDRIGPVFQGPFKAVLISTTEQLIHVSRYIHLNPLVSFVVKEENFLQFPWSSLKNYLSNNPDFVKHQPILENFKTPQKYLQFVLDQADYGKELERIKHLTLEK